MEIHPLVGDGEPIDLNLNQVDDLTEFFQRKWWQFWKPRARREEMTVKLWSALVGEHEPIERFGRIE